MKLAATSISFRTGSGAFCYSIWPTHENTLPGYEARMDALSMQFLGQDRFCPTQR